MNHTQILKRAWNILWSYKAIWVFGILLALTTASGSGGGSGGGGGGGGGSSSQFTPPDGTGQFFNNLGEQLSRLFTPAYQQTLIAILVGLTCFFILLIAVAITIHNVSLVALIRMVDHYEATGEKAGVRQGFRLGWSRAAWRVFLIDLVIGLPFVLGFIILFGIASIPVLLSLAIRGQPSIPGIVASVGLGFLLIFLAIVIGALLSLIFEIIHRVCVLEGEGVFASIRAGWQLVVRNFWNVFLMWLILVGIGIAYAILLIPIFFLLLVLGGLSGGGVGVGLYFLIHALGNEITAWIAGIGLGLLILIAVLILPLLFLGGLKESYTSTAWTLAFRQLRPMAVSTPLFPAVEPPPASDLPSAA